MMNDMKSIKAGLIAIVAVLTIQVANAHPNHRVRQGVRTGQLTPHEAEMLRVQKAHVQSLKRIARADGHVTPRERVIINRSQRSLNRNIYRQKHDVDRRRHCR